MTEVKASCGACGFTARIKAGKVGRRKVIIELESDCEEVSALGDMLTELGPFSIKDIMTRGIEGNPIMEAGSAMLSHAACPVLVAILKAAEVELGLNVPSDVTIEFNPEDKA